MTDPPEGRGARLVSFLWLAFAVWMIWPRGAAGAGLRRRALMVGIRATHRGSQALRAASDALTDRYREV